MTARDTKEKAARGNKLDEFQLVPDAELIALRARLEAEMRRRKINFSVGDMGEELVIEYFNKTPGLPNLQRAPRGTKNVDALSRKGDRFSIKTIWNAKKTGTIYPDPISNEKQLFEYLLVVRLNDNWELASIHQISWEEFVRMRFWDKRMNAWYVGCSPKNLLQVKVVFRNDPAGFRP